MKTISGDNSDLLNLCTEKKKTLGSLGGKVERMMVRCIRGKEVKENDGRLGSIEKRPNNTRNYTQHMRK